jgi:hypothetical protein
MIFSEVRVELTGHIIPVRVLSGGRQLLEGTTQLVLRAQSRQSAPITLCPTPQHVFLSL